MLLVQEAELETLLKLVTLVLLTQVMVEKVVVEMLVFRLVLVDQV
jgi:hypothetical protein